MLTISSYLWPISRSRRWVQGSHSASWRGRQRQWEDRYVFNSSIYIRPYPSWSHSRHWVHLWSFYFLSITFFYSACSIQEMQSTLTMKMKVPYFLKEIYERVWMPLLVKRCPTRFHGLNVWGSNQGRSPKSSFLCVAWFAFQWSDPTLRMMSWSLLHILWRMGTWRAMVSSMLH